MILKIKHWQLFPILIIGYIMTIFSIESSIGITVVLKVLGSGIIFGWLLLLGRAIAHIDKRDSTFFTFNVIIVFATIATFTVLGRGDEYKVEGIIALPFMYVMYALIHVFAFPMKVLKSIKLKRDVKFGDYWGLFFLLIFWVIGIWIIQPKLNKLSVNIIMPAPNKS
jgi:hypothetical protein